MQKRGFSCLLASRRASVQAIPTVHFLAMAKPGPKHRATNSGCYGLCHREEISPQALNYQPWPSIQGCFLSCTVSGSSASIAAVPVPVPGTPVRPSGTLEAGESRPPLRLAVPLRGGSCFQRMGVTRTGLSHPSHPALIGYPASEAKE